MFAPLLWLLLIVGAGLWVGSTPYGWDFNADGAVTVSDLWRVGGVVLIVPVIGVVFGIVALVPDAALRFLEFGDAAEWIIKGPLSGLIGAASWLAILILLFRGEFRLMQRISPGGWEHLFNRRP